ncbi:MAG: exopolyphosphatase [Lachnospiraceae bacterium]|nr:exopolyphosphatase [Lachnospiraceae bacterium]
MARLFAAIDVGSYEVGMKIFQFTGGKNMTEIDHVRKRIELGTDTYKYGKISQEGVDELCDILNEFKTVIKSYGVNDHRAYGTSAIRETENSQIVLEQIKLRTGFDVKVLSNSEQRFLHYKAVALHTAIFNAIMNKGSLLLDMGGGSIQLSLFQDDDLVTTQNIRLGILRMRDDLLEFSNRSTIYSELIEELIDNQLDTFKRLYLEDRIVENIVIVDDYISPVIQKLSGDDNLMSRESLEGYLTVMKQKSHEEVIKFLGLTQESASLLTPSVTMLERVFNMSGAKRLWAPGVGVADGIAYEYARENNFIRDSHDFDNDILACAREMGVKYHCNTERNALLEKIAGKLFDSTKKLHGMGARERLLIRIAAILNDCGKYISLEGAAECGFSIIMATEILGLSHAERLVVASVVRYNKLPFEYYEKMARQNLIDRETYLKTAKLTAVFRIADGICRSHRTKVNDIKTGLKEKKLYITIDSDEDISLENRFFDRKADFFKEVFSVQPVLKYKKAF